MTGREGFVEVQGHDFYFRTFGEEHRGSNIVCLHGGPGASHGYLLSLADLAKKGHMVVFYDQLGCGRSQLPKNPALLTIERAVEDLEHFRRAMKLGRIHLFGSSYGGLLAIAYALKYQRNLRSMITAGGIASVPLTTSEMDRLRKGLPSTVQKTMEKYEDQGEYNNPDYLKAVDVFYRKHLCRLKKWPPEVAQTLQNISVPVYGTMNGPNEFTIIGNIRYWDASTRLRTIRVPTLVTGGKYDEVTPKVARQIHDGIKGSKMVIFERSSHLPMWEQRKKYMDTLARFLRSVK